MGSAVKKKLPKCVIKKGGVSVTRPGFDSKPEKNDEKLSSTGGGVSNARPQRGVSMTKGVQL